MMSDSMLATVRRQVQERGPDRVLVGASGEALPSARALELFGLVPSVVFIRNDGWTLGAPSELERAAYLLWAGEWVAKMERCEGRWVHVALG